VGRAPFFCDEPSVDEMDQKASRPLFFFSPSACLFLTGWSDQLASPPPSSAFLVLASPYSPSLLVVREIVFLSLDPPVRPLPAKAILTTIWTRFPEVEESFAAPPPCLFFFLHPLDLCLFFLCEGLEMNSQLFGI